MMTLIVVILKVLKLTLLIAFKLYGVDINMLNLMFLSKISTLENYDKGDSVIVPL